MDERRVSGGRVRAAVYAVIVVMAGIGGMIGYWLLVGRPVNRWPVGDTLLMVGTTLVAAAVVHTVTDRLLVRHRHHADV